MEKKIKEKNKEKVKVKRLVYPAIASLFIIALIVVGSVNLSFEGLTGNSVINGYICPDGYSLSENMCVKETDAIMLGDLNGNGKIDSEDLQFLNEVLEGTRFLEGANFNAADLDGDKNITEVDKNLLVDAILDGKLDKMLCPDNYVLNGKKCTLKKRASKIIHSEPFGVGSAVSYNGSYWYVLNSGSDYVTLLKAEPLTKDELKNYPSEDNLISYSDTGCTNNCSDYNTSLIKKAVDGYGMNIQDDLKEVNGYKIRLITLDELKGLGFIDKSNTHYYEMDTTTPFFIGSNGNEYWTMSSINLNKAFTVVDYDDESFVFESDTNVYGEVRPVINLLKAKIK